MSAPSASPRPASLAAVLEGAPADAFVALATGSALTGWALAYDAPPLYLAMLQSLFVGMQVLQPLAAWVTQRVSRRPLAIGLVLLSRGVWLVMSLVTVLDVPRDAALAVLLAVAAISAAAHVARENTLGTWLGDIVPAASRGAFYAQRSRLAVVASSVASVLLATLLSTRPDRGALGVLGGVIAGLGCLSAWAFLRMPLGPEPRSLRRGTLSDALLAPGVSTYLRYQLAFAFVVSPGVAFFSYWVLHGVGGTYLLLAIHAVVLAVARVSSAPLWGRVVDVEGPRRVLVLCSMGTGLMPLLWTTLTPDRHWPLLVDAVISGVLWGGQSIALFDVPLRLSRPAERAQVLALGAVAAGLGWLAGSAFFGRLTELLSTSVSEPLRWVFVVAGVGRMLAALVATRIPTTRSEPDLDLTHA